MSIIITQLIYIKEGEEHIFHQFEDLAIPLISRYNGSFLLRIRPEANQIIAGSIDHPYEVHIVKFNSDMDFQYFMQDKERKKFLHLKENSVKSVLMIKGSEI